MVFLENDRDLGVKNGTLGTVKAVEPDALHVELDGSMLSPGDGVGLVKIDTNSYQSLDHGYATTIHKNQGAPRGSIDKAVAAAVMNAARWDEGIAAVGKPEGCVLLPMPVLSCVPISRRSRPVRKRGGCQRKERAALHARGCRASFRLTSGWNLTLGARV